MVLAQRLKRCLPCGLGAMLIYECQQVDGALAATFFPTLASARELAPANPIGVLRRRLHREWCGRMVYNDQLTAAALTIIAWNLMRQGKPCQHVYWKGAVNRHIPFPVIG